MIMKIITVDFGDDLNEALLGVLDALTRELRVRTDLHKAETQAILSQLGSEAKQAEVEDKTYKGMMRAPFGYCPKCGEPGMNRERAAGFLPHGREIEFWDVCSNAHNYLSSKSITANNAAILKQKMQEQRSEEKKGDDG